MRGRLGVLFTILGLLGAGLAVATAPASAAGSLPSRFSLDPSVRQLVTVTSPRWSNTHARLRVWRRRNGSWHLVRGPVRVSLGWNGWVPARKRRQSTGTTPAGSFSMRYAFGNRRDPGTELRYRRVDGNDFWPYEPRDAATYNIYQPHKAGRTRWRPDYAERLADYGYEYAYAVVLGFNLPRGVHWSRHRRQWVARRPAHTDRGGGIFLHVKQRRYTAGCVAGPLRDVRWLVRWLDPDAHPRIVMGPRRWLVRRF
ncbi:MAG TPA: L,D-transpeptidase family protein [Nocardioidaceae bacterium]|nr:L,D-transpeptidase family protein [Nocardioidaceae bacterium]